MTVTPPSNTVWNWLGRLALLATLISAIIGGMAFWEQREALRQAETLTQATLEELDAVKRDRETNLETQSRQEIVGAWGLLAGTGAGDAGRRQAIEYLHEMHENLQGIDVSCLRLAGADRFVEGRCLDNVDFRDVDLRNARLDEANFSGSIIDLSDFSSVSAWWTNFRGTSAVQVDFRNSELNGSDFTGANLRGAKFDGADLSGTVFINALIGATGAENRASFEDAWAWADQYPKGLPEGLLTVCEPVFFERNDVAYRHSGQNGRAEAKCRRP